MRFERIDGLVVHFDWRGSVSFSTPWWALTQKETDSIRAALESLGFCSVGERKFERDAALMDATDVFLEISRLVDLRASWSGVNLEERVRELEEQLRALEARVRYLE